MLLKKKPLRLQACRLGAQPDPLLYFANTCARAPMKLKYKSHFYRWGEYFVTCQRQAAAQCAGGAVK